MSDTYPQGVERPSESEPVVVMMTEAHARMFERRVLAHTNELAGPMIFSEDDLPTYIIGIKDQYR